MTTHEINLLIERYLDGETTPAEERELALAVQREDRPTEWAIIGEMLGELTRDEALYEWTLQTHPRPLPGGRGEVTTPMISLSEEVVSAPPPPGRGWGWVPWVSAAACVAIAFGLSYNIIIKEKPKETANTEQLQPTQKQQKSIAIAVPPQANHKEQLNQKARQAHVNEPLDVNEEPLPQMEMTPAEKPFIAAQAEEPLPELQPQPITAVDEFPPSEDLALYLSLLAEVEARAAMLQQAQQTQQPQPLAEWRREVTSSTINLSENVVSPPSLSGSDGVGLLLDELLAYIQQQSNRPELSL